MAHHRNTIAIFLVSATLGLTGCQRAAEENAAGGNLGGNQALSQNPNAMGDAGLPPTADTGPAENYGNVSSVSNVSGNSVVD